MNDGPNMVPNQYRAQLESAKSGVQTAKETATGSPTAASIHGQVDDGWGSPTATTWLSDLESRGNNIGSKFDSLIGNLDAEINGEPAEVPEDDPRATRNNPGRPPI